MSNLDPTGPLWPSEREQRLDAALAELIRAEEAGDETVRARLLAEHPDLADDLEQFQQQRGRIKSLLEPLREAAAEALHVRCPHCHNPIELLEQTPLSSISCPSCGSDFSLITNPSGAYCPPNSKNLGHFELLELVGMGQFGGVWRARDTKLDRTVAVKIPRRGELDEQQTELFLRDARAAAQLKHPNIVGVHEVGRHEDTVYIVSDFVAGATLRDWLAENKLTPRESARFCVTLAEALHHAHELGVVHRDLKPGNIMLDLDGTPHIVDFGLAKRESGEITMTVAGQILGTPAYMSPEQARGEGHLVDRRADVYSLGVILFELLTGELPFRGEKRMLLDQIVSDEPPCPRRLNSAVPRDLETICLKCLAKDPARRYGTALELADDLERFAAGEPIVARPVSRLERAWRWCRRNPTVASLSAATVVSLASIAAVATLGYFREADLHDQAEESRAQLETTLLDLTQEQRQSARLRQDVATLETRRSALSASLEAGARSLVEGEEKLFETYLRLARRAWREDNVELADYFLNQCPPSMRTSRAWHDLKRQCHPDMVSYPGGKSAVFSPDGALLAAIDDAGVNVWDLSTGESRYRLRPGARAVSAVAFRPDGAWLAANCHDEIVIWDLTNGKVLHTLSYEPGHLTDLAFSPDGRRLAAASWHRPSVKQPPVGRVVLWDVETFQRERTLPGAQYVVFNHDGRLLATSRISVSVRGWSQSLVVWDLQAPSDADLQPLLNLNASRCRPAFHPFVNELAVSHGGDAIRFWDIDARQIVRRFTGDLAVDCLAYSADGKRLASAGQTSGIANKPHSFRVVTWNLITHERERQLPWFSSSISSMDFSPDSQRLATADDESIKLWDVTPPPDPTAAILSDIVDLDVGQYDWPQWGGSRARINSPAGENIPTSWDVGQPQYIRKNGRWVKNDAWAPGPVPPEAENIKWAAKLGSQTYGNPVVANGRLFLGTNNGAGYLKRYPREVDLGVLLCFDEQTGEFLWQHSNEKLPTGRVHDWPLQGVCSTPMIDGDRLWYVSNRGEVVCLDTEGFYDGEDDGPVVDEWVRLLPLSPAHERGRQHRDTLDDLRRGVVSAWLRSEFERVGMPLPEEVQMQPTDKAGRLWTLSAVIDDVERRFRIELNAGGFSVFTRLDVADRREADVVWKLNMMTELGVSQHNMATCSVITVDGLLFVCTSNGLDESHINLPAPEAPSFIALDRDTGEVVWTDNSPGRNILHAQWASPSYGVFDGRPQVIFPGGDGWVYSFDPQGDGAGGSKLLWKFDANPKTSKWILGGRGTRNNIIAFPAIYDGLVYIVVGQDPEHGEGNGHLWCIDPTKRMDGGDVSAELAVDRQGNILPPRRIQAVDLAKGERAIPNPDSAVVWHYSHQDQNGDGRFDFDEVFHRSISIPVIKDDILYVADFSGLFHCLNAKTGRVYWTHDLLAACWGSALLVDGKVYICDEDGEVTVFRHSADPRIAMKPVKTSDGFTEYVPINAGWEGELINECYMNTPIYMTPIVANNVLYIATKDVLYAIAETESQTESPTGTQTESATAEVTPGQSDAETAPPDDSRPPG